MNEDSRNDHGPVQSGAASASTGISAESPSRREFLVEKVGLGALVSATGLVAAAAAAQPVETRIATPLKPGITTLSGRRVVTLNVKLPNNVDLKTNIGEDARPRGSGRRARRADPRDGSHEHKGSGLAEAQARKLLGLGHELLLRPRLRCPGPICGYSSQIAAISIAAIATFRHPRKAGP